ncbi:MAG: DUF2062 domain-containing protein [Deltaproteobacteria bacterium]|nr:DUF2062 domain-containing protein [Deltaproteobacteria bacterium]
MRESKSGRGLRERIARYVRHQRLRLLRVKASPESVARGMAIGVFVGFIPLLPSQTLVAVGLAVMLKSSKLAAAIGTLVTNPFTWVFLYLLFYRIGRAILPFDIPPLDISRLDARTLLDSGWRMAAAMVAGGLILAVPSSILAYYASLRGILAYRTRRTER